MIACVKCYYYGGDYGQDWRMLICMTLLTCCAVEALKKVQVQLWVTYTYTDGIFIKVCGQDNIWMQKWCMNQVNNDISLETDLVISTLL